MIGSKRQLIAISVVTGALLLGGVGVGLSPLQGQGNNGRPPIAGEIGKFALANEVRPAPLTPIQTLGREVQDLSQFQGKVVLLNFWATWCVPCIAELPTLARLQAQFRSDEVLVIALSIDRGGAEKVGPFLAEHGIENLTAYLDPKSEALRAFNAQGLPTTYLLDRQGGVIGSLTGPADWDSDAAVALIAHYLETT